MRPALPANAWLRYDAVTRALGRLGPLDTILEIGCGLGAMGTRLRRRCREYVGVEPDPESRTVASARLPRVVPDLADVPAAPGFDAVLAFEVLEHLEDDRRTLRSWTAFARPGGAVMVSVPGDPSRWGAWDEYAGHLRRYSAEDLHHALAGAGLVDVCVVGYGGALGYVLEGARNAVARRARARESTLAARTGASGRRLQPPPALGPITAAGTAPFRALQRAVRPDGPGLVAWGRRPSESSPRP